MSFEKIWIAGQTKALDYVGAELARMGLDTVKDPGDAQLVLLDVPVRNDPGTILAQLPRQVTVAGGNLQDLSPLGYPVIDLLQDPVYLAKNANITAHCAVKIALNHLPVILQDLPVLVLGWGRIGKCLARLLRNMGAQVWVYARKETDRATLSALGYEPGAPENLQRYRIVFNTVPAPMLHQPPDGSPLMIDLASQPGLEGPEVIYARGLPGKEAAESSGKLIAQRLLHFMKGVPL